MQNKCGIRCTLFIKNIIDGSLHKYVVLTERGSVLLCISTTFGKAISFSKAMSLLKIPMLQHLYIVFCTVTVEWFWVCNVQMTYLMMVKDTTR